MQLFIIIIIYKVTQLIITKDIEFNLLSNVGHVKSLDTLRDYLNRLYIMRWPLAFGDERRRVMV